VLTLAAYQTYKKGKTQAFPSSLMHCNNEGISMLFAILQRVVMQLHITHTRSGQALETTLSKHNNCDCRQLVENIERLKRLRGKKEKWKAPCWGRSKQ